MNILQSFLIWRHSNYNYNDFSPARPFHLETSDVQLARSRKHGGRVRVANYPASSGRSAGHAVAENHDRVGPTRHSKAGCAAPRAQPVAADGLPARRRHLPSVCPPSTPWAVFQYLVSPRWDVSLRVAARDSAATRRCAILFLRDPLARRRRLCLRLGLRVLSHCRISTH